MNYNEMVGWYGQEALDIAGYPGPETRVVVCAACGGDGAWEWEGESPRCQSGKCHYCDGAGEVEIEAVPVTADDLENEIERSRPALSKD